MGTSITGPWLPQAVDLMWNVVDAYPPAAAQLDEDGAIRLAEAFFAVLRDAADNGYRKQVSVTGMRGSWRDDFLCGKML